MRSMRPAPSVQLGASRRTLSAPFGRGACEGTHCSLRRFSPQKAIERRGSPPPRCSFAPRAVGMFLIKRDEASRINVQEARSRARRIIAAALGSGSTPRVGRGSSAASDRPRNRKSISGAGTFPMGMFRGLQVGPRPMARRGRRSWKFCHLSASSWPKPSAWGRELWKRAPRPWRRGRGPKRPAVQGFTLTSDPSSRGQGAARGCKGQSS